MTPFERLTQMRAAYPDVMTQAQIGELLNALAWENLVGGMRLLGKAGGNNVPQPRTGTLISSDYLVHLPTLTGVDALTDNGTKTKPMTRNGIPVAFTWGPGKEDLRGWIASGARSIVDPVAPIGGGEPLPEPEPDPDPEPNPDLEGWMHRLEARIVKLEALEREMHGQIGALNQQLKELSERTGPPVGPHVHRLYGLRTGGPEPG